MLRALAVKNVETKIHRLKNLLKEVERVINTRMEFPRCLRILVFGLFVSLSALQRSDAGEEGDYISLEISRAFSKALVVNVYVLPPGANVRYDLGEGDVMRMGCKFELHNPAEIHNFAGIVASSNLRMDSDVGAVDGRVLIRISDDYKNYSTLLMGYGKSNSTSHGVYNGDIPVFSEGNFEKNLRAWIARNQTLNTKSCLH